MAYKNVYPFGPPSLFKKIVQQTATRDYKYNEVVFEQGTKADAMFYLQSGNVKLVAKSKNGKKSCASHLAEGRSVW